MQRKLIEYDLPLAEISEESAREKNIRHGHPSTLHIWWARRPLASSRATTFAALIEDPLSETGRADLRRLIKDITPWDAVKNGNSPAIEEARRRVLDQFGGEPPKVLDPFAGGGSIPLEALRLGCETYASDYNPVAVFIEKATLEWPQKFGVQVQLPDEEEASGDLSDLRRGSTKVNLLAHLVERWANLVLEAAREEVSRFYPTEDGSGLVGKRDITAQEGWTPVGYLWARTIRCQNPSCKAEIPLIRQFWLAKKKNKRIAYRPVVDHSVGTVEFEIIAGKELKRAQHDGFDPKNGTTARANAECLVCGQVTKAKQVRQLAGDGKMGERMVAVVLHHLDETGKKYRLATEQDRQDLKAAQEHLERKLEEWPYLEFPLPTEECRGTFASNAQGGRYSFDTFADYFNPRQQLTLVTFLEKLRESHEAIEVECREIIEHDDGQAATFRPGELKRAVVGYLGIILDKTADYTSRLTRWANHGEYVGNTLSRQALSMTWDYFETSPVSDSGGDWRAQTNWVLRYIENNDWTASTPATVAQASATDLSSYPDDHFDAVLTDPPYYDNVAYGDLSDFFYVWLKRAVGKEFPELFSTPLIPKADEAIVDHFRMTSKKEGKLRFERMLQASFTEIRRVLKPGGVSVIVYAHKTTEGWETMLNALVEVGLVVTGSWPVHTEMKNRLVAAQSAALASSIYMVCRKAEQEPRGWWDEVRRDVEVRVEKKLTHLWEEDLIRGGDFFISAIGPGMEAYSRYERVETYEGKRIEVLDLLDFIRSVATDFLVHRLLRDASTEAVDKESQFYLTYRWTYGDNRVEFDDARRIATAEGVRLDTLSGDGGFVDQARKYVSVLGPKDKKRKTLKAEDVDNLVDAVHRACQLWEQEHREELDDWLQREGYAGRSAFWQYCQAVAECLTNGNKEKQLLEGLLVRKDRYRPGSAPSEEQTQTEMELHD